MTNINQVTVENLDPSSSPKKVPTTFIFRKEPPTKYCGKTIYIDEDHEDSSLFVSSKKVIKERWAVYVNIWRRFHEKSIGSLNIKAKIEIRTRSIR